MSPVLVPVAFLLLAGILAWIMIGIRGRWWLKAPAIVGVAWLAVATWVTMADLQGWPADMALPGQFEVHAVLVREPSKTSTDQGAIYLWATSTRKEPRSGWWLLSLSSPRGHEPRCYKAPFSADGAAQALAADMLLKDGRRVFGEARPRRAKSKAEDESAMEDRLGSEAMSLESGFEMYELPPSRLLPKGNQ